MRVHRELSIGIAAIVSVQIIVSTLTIGLLARMGPAIERILEENVYSAQAVEDMLAAVALGVDAEPNRSRFDEALKRAQNNVTEESEKPLLETIEKRGAELKESGSEVSKKALVSDLVKLGQINRDSMIRADEEAKNLSLAGAWAAAFLGAFNLALGWLILRRFRVRFGIPVDELGRTLRDFRNGNTQARGARLDAPMELQQMVVDLNQLLDSSLFEPREPLGTDQTDIRIVTNHLLDKIESPTIVLNRKGEVVARNRPSLGLVYSAGPEWLVRELPHGLSIASHQPPA
jgi:hypothetical protein